MLRIVVRVKGALLPDQPQQSLAVDREGPVLPVFQVQGVGFLQVPDGEGVELVFHLAVNVAQVGQVHGETEAGRVILGGQQMVQVRMAGGVDAVQLNILLLEQPADHLGGVESRHIEGKRHLGELGKVRPLAEFLNAARIRIREIML